MKKQALLVIDVQNIYTADGAPLAVEVHAGVVANINTLIRHFESKNWPIVYVRHAHDPSGSDSGRMWDYSGTAGEIGFVAGTSDVEYTPSLTISPGAPEIIKHRYSAFTGTGLEKLLKTLDVDTLVVTGFMTNYCCEATARQGHDMDYFVKFVMDATGCPDLPTLNQADIKVATEATLSEGYAIVLNTSDLVTNS